MGQRIMMIYSATLQAPDAAICAPSKGYAMRKAR